MTWFLAIPATVLPLALLVAAMAWRRVVEASEDLRREIDAGDKLRTEVEALRADLDGVAQRCFDSPRTRGAGPPH